MSLTGIALNSVVRWHEFSNSLLRVVAIAHGSSGFELSDGVIDGRTVLRVSERCPVKADFLVINFPRTATFPTAYSRGGETGHCISDDRFEPKFIEAAVMRTNGHPSGMLATISRVNNLTRARHRSAGTDSDRGSKPERN